MTTLCAGILINPTRQKLTAAVRNSPRWNNHLRGWGCRKKICSKNIFSKKTDTPENGPHSLSLHIAEPYSLHYYINHSLLGTPI